MIYILWSVLNLVAYLALLYLVIQATNLLKQHINLGAALFFLFGLIFLSGSTVTNSQPPSPPNLLSGTPPDAPLSNAHALEKISLGSNTLSLVAEYYEQDSLLRPRRLCAVISGLTLGHQWQPLAGSLTQHGNQMRYQVQVSHGWKLFGKLLYTSPPLLLTGTMAKHSR